MDEKHINEINGNVKCNCCENLFRTERGLRHCQTNLNTEPTKPKPSDKPENIMEISTYKWGKYTNKHFAENVSSIYEKIVYWKNNIFLLPTGKSERCFIDETKRLIDAWIRGSLLKNIALNTVIIMPSLLLQKPNKDSKTTVFIKTTLKL